MKVTNEHVFFWGGPFSNWYTSPITIKKGEEILGTVFESEYILPTSEHFFMLLKALKFEDIESAIKILKSETPKEAKKLGRKVKGFNDAEWVDFREEAMIMSLQRKFTENESLKKELLSTKYKGKSFVEASPYDKIWGIGFEENDPEIENKRKDWGLNLLGKCLNVVRKEFEGE